MVEKICFCCIKPSSSEDAEKLAHVVNIDNSTVGSTVGSTVNSSTSKDTEMNKVDGVDVIVK